MSFIRRRGPGRIPRVVLSGLTSVEWNEGAAFDHCMDIRLILRIYKYASSDFVADTDNHKNWTLKDGWEQFKKIVSRPERVASIQEGFLKLNTKLTVTENMFVKDRNRMSQFYTSFADGSISIDFWENGMCWHSQFLFDTDKVSLAAYLWNDLRANSDEIERQIAEIKFPVKRKKIEINNREYIKWHWQDAVDKAEFRSKNDIELVRLLSKDERVNKLMTFRQLWDLGFSRYIGESGEDLKNDLLRATITDDTIFVRTEQQATAAIWQGTQACIGQGGPEEAYALIVNNLPTDIDWGEYQTLEQYEQRTAQGSR